MSLLREARYAPPSRRGVLYFNTVPRDMRPQEVRLHFNQFGDIHRMRFVPFPKKTRRPGGPLLPLQYKEGWMEFTVAADAQNAAQRMNGQPIDVKRQRRCFGQLWTVRFMEDFTWDSLLEEAEGRRRARRATEVEARRSERSMNEAYRRMVMQAEAQRSAKRRRRETASDGHDGDGEVPHSSEEAGGADGSVAHAGSGTATRSKAAAHSAKSKAASAKKSERDTAKKPKRRRDDAPPRTRADQP
ncbi:RNA binding protein [Novymonas esmeraldas]|uniref:RNA binding protein n=1 Tax=Novymonas esmeraldas TaxID=1808958 RepID=A0AAW0EWN6_9TRYP